VVKVRERGRVVCTPDNRVLEVLESMSESLSEQLRIKRSFIIDSKVNFLPTTSQLSRTLQTMSRPLVGTPLGTRYPRFIPHGLSTDTRSPSHSLSIHTEQLVAVPFSQSLVLSSWL